MSDYERVARAVQITPMRRGSHFRASLAFKVGATPKHVVVTFTSRYGLRNDEESVIGQLSRVLRAARRAHRGRRVECLSMAQIKAIEAKRAIKLCRCSACHTRGESQEGRFCE